MINTNLLVYPNDEDEERKIMKYLFLSGVTGLDNENAYKRKKEQEDLLYGFKKRFIRTLKNNDKKIQNLKLKINADNVEKLFTFNKAYYLAIKLLSKKEKAIFYYFYIQRLPMSKIASKIHASYSTCYILKNQMDLHLKNNFYTMIRAIKVANMMSKGGDLNE